jgi:hypothetical protein
MSLYPPPLEDQAIFNPVNWEASTQGDLTQQQADARYIFKTQSDTATGLITFTNGIVTNSLQSYTGNISIGSNGTANNIVIGSSNTNVFLYGNVTSIEVSNLVVEDASIILNKNGISPLGAGIEIESNGSIVSSMLNDINGDFVFTSGNNRIYVDSIGEKTANSNITFIDPILVNDGSGTIAKVEPSFFYLENGSDRGFLKLNPASDFNMGTSSNLDLYLKTWNTTRMTIEGDGSNINMEIPLIMKSEANVLGNLRVSKEIIATGNITGGNLITNGSLGTNGNLSAGNISTTGLLSAGNISTSVNISAGNISTIQAVSVGTNMTVTGQANVSGVFNCGTGVGTSTFNYQDVRFLGSATSSSGILRFTRDANINYLQTALTASSGNGAPLIISPWASVERWMTITRTGIMIGNTVANGVVPPSNLYVLGNALISSNLTVQSSISATSGLNALNGSFGNTSSYAVFLNTAMGTGNIGVTIENSSLGNTIIQPQHQGVAWRNTYLNPNGGLVAIGSTTPPNATDELYVNGTANINGLLSVMGNANIRGNANIAGIVRIESTQGTFATGNGALVVSGGVGIGADINMGGNLNAGGALISASNTTEALRIIGGGTMTGTMVANQFTGNNVVSGNLLIGGASLSEGVKCSIRNNVVDTVVNGTTLGNATNLIEMENANRSWYFGTSGSVGDQFYIGSTGGTANDPDYLFYLDSGGRLMAYPPVSGAITAPNSTDIFTARGNANISTNLWVGGRQTFIGDFTQTGGNANIAFSTTGRRVFVNTGSGDTCTIDMNCKDGTSQAYDARIIAQNGNASATGRANLSIISDNLFFGSVSHIPTEFESFATNNNFTGDINFGTISRSILTDIGQRTLNGVSSVEWTNIPVYAREIKIVYKSDVRSAVADIRFEVGTPASYQTSGYEILAYRDGGFSDYVTVAIPTFTATYPINTDSYHELTIKLIGTQVSGSTSRNVYSTSGTTYYNDAGTRRGCDVMGIFNTPYTTTTDNNFYISRVRLFVTAGTFNDTAGNSFARLYWN